MAKNNDDKLSAKVEKRQQELARGGVSQALSRRDSAKKPDRRVDK
jgi:hypothetical protein